MDPPDFRLGSHDCNNLTNPAKVSSSPNGEVDANCSLYVVCNLNLCIPVNNDARVCYASDCRSDPMWRIVTWIQS